MKQGLSVLLFIGVILSIRLAPSSQAADVTAVNRPHCNVLLAGEIRKGDLNKLEAMYPRPLPAQQLAICLDSPGGSLDEAINIGEFLDAHQVRTVVDDGASCLSACAVTFMYGGYGYAGNGRSIHVNAKLGFHAPFLNLGDAGGSEATFTRETVERSYDVAMAETARIMKLAEVKFSQSGFSESKSAFSARLLVEMLAAGRGNMFYIDTVEKAIMAGVDLNGFERPRSIGRAEYINTCEHTYVHVFGLRGWRIDEDIDAAQPPKVSQDGAIRGLSFMEFESRNECISRIPNAPTAHISEGGTYFEHHDGSRIDTYGAGEDLATPIWYLYASTSPITCLSAAASVACKKRRSIVAPSSQYCLDHSEAEACPRYLDRKRTVTALPRMKVDPSAATAATRPGGDTVGEFTRLASTAFKYGGEEAFTVVDYAACERRCREQTGCRALTYFKDRRLCRLMSASADRLPNENAVSAVKAQ